MDYRRTRIISGKGSRDDQFAETLRGICVDRSGLLYAVGDETVKVFDAEGKLVRHWSTGRPGYCVAVDDDGVVHVGEPGQVERFDSSGKHLGTWSDADRFGLITTIGFSGEFVLLADAQDRCIRKCDRSGKWLGDIGTDNNTRGFLIPNGHLEFDVDAEGIIHAINSAKYRVERYTLDGKLLGHFGRFGMKNPEDFPGCCNPTNLTLSPEGHIIVTEKAGPRLKIFDADGKLLSLVGSEAFDANCKNMDVAVDANGRIYVVDTVQLHIVVFVPVAAPAKTAVGHGE